MIRLVLLGLLSLSILFGEHGSVEFHEVRGRSLEANLSGDSPVRDVAVYLPPSYAAESDRRYPVVYMLHGFTDSVEKWWSNPDHWINLPAVLDKSMARDDTREVIVVMPDALTRFYGSFYSSSVTTGDWETFIADELVAFIDSHYRTIPVVASRGLAGHSMGGYGTMRIGMKNPDVFSSLYLLNPCCLAAMPRQTQEGAPPWEQITTDEELAAAPFMIKVILSISAAWAPNPQNPPFYLDLPTRDGEIRPEVVARLTANAQLALIDQYIGELRELRGIAFDAGDKEAGISAAVRELDRVLNSYEIEHDAEVYEGNHINRVAERIETKVMPFFAERLEFE